MGRGDTTVVDAYLSPVLRRYVDQVASELTGEPEAPAEAAHLMFMMSSGGLTDASLFQGRDAILSGPAGGVVGYVETARIAGFDKVIGFDMGGTSTDVSHFEGEYERTFETEVAGVRMRAPMMLIHTVAAGGGSILHFDGSRFQLARTRPEPIRDHAVTGAAAPLRSQCQRHAGQARPKVLSLDLWPERNQPLDVGAVRQGFLNLAQQIGDGRPPEAVADGFVRIAVENMANAIKKISVQRGYDVTEYALQSFGGAGGQHACLVAAPSV